MKKQIPKFKNEDEERDFWSKRDSSEYLNWKSAEQALFPKLKPSMRAKTDVDPKNADLPDIAEMLRDARLLRDIQLFMTIGEDQLRQIASKHNFDWDKMSESQREQFIRNLLQ